MILDERIIKGKLQFYKEQNAPVHITLGYFPKAKFHNGLIKEIKEDSFILVDEVVGDLPIYFSEVRDIDKRREKE
jgi:hypothetical protein